MVWKIFCLAFHALRQWLHLQGRRCTSGEQYSFHLAGPASDTEDAGGRGATRLGTLVLGLSLPIPAAVR